MDEKNLKILLIGGSGIISSEVCNLAIDNGYTVYTINRGRREKKINKFAHCIIADVKKETEEELRNKTENISFDVVVDFVSYDINQLKKMLNVFNYRQYIFISTATVYADISSEDGFKESDPKNNELWDYCTKKRECEKYLEGYFREGEVYYSIVRPYVTYNETRFPYQIAPLEYFTIIDRIKRNLPIAICGNNVTTVTTSKEFAVGLIGLVGNKTAYNEDFHITSDMHTTWKHIIKITADKLETTANIIDIPIDFLKKYRHTEINVKEIVGDKSRDMRFDNSKIKEAVPDFTANTIIDEEIDDILRFFSDASSCKVNYIWNGCMDRMLRDFSKIIVRQKDYSISGTKNKIMYRVGYHGFLYSCYQLLKTCKYLIKKLPGK